MIEAIPRASGVGLTEWLQRVAYCVTAAGLIVGLVRYFLAKRKERIDREHAAFAASNARYARYLELCLADDMQAMFDLAHTADYVALALPKKHTIMITWVMAMTETAFVMYDGGSKRPNSQWGAWERYLDIWIRRPDFRKTWPVLRPLFHDSFCRYVTERVSVIPGDAACSSDVPIR